MRTVTWADELLLVSQELARWSYDFM